MTSIPPDIPVYVHIKRELKNQIESGELPEGSRIPSELELARQYGVSRNPTRQAMRDLEQEGYVTRAPGRGSFVAPRAQRQRVLQVGGRRTVAIACPELECRYTRSVVRGFIESAAEAGYHTMVYFLRFSNEAEFGFLADVRNGGIEGVAFWPQHASDRLLSLLTKFRRSAFPFVLIDRYLRGIDADFVVSDNERVAFELTQALIERGHEHIGFISSEMDNTTTQDRMAGYRRALEAASLPYVAELTGVLEVGGELVGRVVSRIMAHRSRPTAFVGANDGVTEKLVDTLTELGYDIPGNVELATIDDNAIAETMGIPMLTASQAGHLMGRRSAEVLTDRIANPGRP
ncbi:MAG: substrate-binding domain-containing protein, partial [Nitrospiraceae bacterium]|nr:substrate-binding domain-containing protein [Nitrospiraceae bacterium]